VQGELPHRVVAEAIRRAHAAGAWVVLNLAPYVSLPAEVVELADPMVLNEEEQRSRELAAPIFAKLGRPEGVPGSLLVTRGTRGAVWGDLDLPATTVPVDEILDTTGAGTRSAVRSPPRWRRVGSGERPARGVGAGPTRFAGWCPARLNHAPSHAARRNDYPAWSFLTSRSNDPTQMGVPRPN